MDGRKEEGLNKDALCLMMFLLSLLNYPIAPARPLQMLCHFLNSVISFDRLSKLADI